MQKDNAGRLRQSLRRRDLIAMLRGGAAARPHVARVVTGGKTSSETGCKLAWPA